MLSTDELEMGLAKGLEGSWALGVTWEWGNAGCVISQKW